LACVEAEQNKRAPFIIRDGQQSFHFRDREWPAVATALSLHEFDRIGGIVRYQAIAFCLFENHSQEFDFMIHSPGANALSF
jgi:hypothetical protein